MAFRFSLDTVLMVRKSIEQREERALQKVQFDIAQIHRDLELLNAQIDKNQSERSRVLMQPTHAYKLLAILGEINGAVEKRQRLLESLKSLEQEKERRMKAYQAAHINRELLTNMQTQQRNAYDAEQTRNQQKMLDEIFASRSSRS